MTHWAATLAADRLDDPSKCQALLAATLPADPDAQGVAVPPKGEIPSPLSPPPGCAYHTRCPFARDICKAQRPEARDGVACHMVHDGGWL